MATGLLLPFVVRRLRPRGWWAMGWPNAILLPLCALPWVVLAVWVSRPSGESGSLQLGPFFGVLVAGAIWTELALLLRRRSTPDSPEAEGEDEEDVGPTPSGTTPLSEDATALLRRALSLEDTDVQTLMTARDDVIVAGGGATAGEVLDSMRESGRTRVVIVEGSLDRILGIAHAKDLTPLALEGGASEPVRRHLRRLLRVPRRLSTRRLVEEFRRNRVTIGAVADVRGRTLGVVTLSDVFRFLASRESAASREETP